VTGILGWSTEAAVGVALLAISASTRAQDFHRLSGAQIQSTVVGQRITDDTHWSQTVAPGGRLLVRDMGHASTGTWQIKKDRLCIDRPGVLDDCYEVWLAGDAIQLRTKGAMPLTVFLRPAAAR
jgi:hypothetical protein